MCTASCLHRYCFPPPSQVNGFYPIQLARELVSRSLAHHSRGPHAPLAFAKSLRRISRRCAAGGEAGAMAGFE